MTIEQAIVEKLRALPVEKQQEVLDFVEFLSRAPLSPKCPTGLSPRRHCIWGCRL